MESATARRTYGHVVNMTDELPRRCEERLQLGFRLHEPPPHRLHAKALCREVTPKPPLRPSAVPLFEQQQLRERRGSKDQGEEVGEAEAELGLPLDGEVHCEEGVRLWLLQVGQCEPVGPRVRP